MKNEGSFRALPGMVGKFRIGWWVKSPLILPKDGYAFIVDSRNDHADLLLFNKTMGWKWVPASKCVRSTDVTPAQAIKFMTSLEASQIGKDHWLAIQKAVKTVDEGESLQKVCARIGEAVVHNNDYSKKLFLPKAVKATKVEEPPVTTEEQKAEAPKAEAPTA